MTRVYDFLWEKERSTILCAAWRKIWTTCLIDYNVIGAVALNQHGYRRFTEDIDLLLTREGLEKFRNELVGKEFRPAFEGATRKFKRRGKMSLSR
jgi:hypothetical protein